MSTITGQPASAKCRRRHPEAAFDAVNEAGGINGFARSVHYSRRQGRPGRCRGSARDLIDNQEVA